MLAHGEDLRAELVAAVEDPGLADALTGDDAPPALSPRRAAIRDYAVKATRTPAAMTEADLAPLRAVGLADADLLTLAHVIGFFNGVNRVADCLHVDAEP